MYRSSIRRGDVYYITKGPTTGAEQQAGRPAVIVSNNKNNQYSETVEAVFLTTRPKKWLPTHTNFSSTGRASTVLCEQVQTISVERLSDYICRASTEEMRAIDNALLCSLALANEHEALSFPSQGCGFSSNNCLSAGSAQTNCERLTIERDMYKHLYETLVDKMCEARQTTATTQAAVQGGSF